MKNFIKQHTAPTDQRDKASAQLLKHCFVVIHFDNEWIGRWINKCVNIRVCINGSQTCQKFVFLWRGGIFLIIFMLNVFLRHLEMWHFYCASTTFTVNLNNVGPVRWLFARLRTVSDVVMSAEGLNLSPHIPFNLCRDHHWGPRPLSLKVCYEWIINQDNSIIWAWLFVSVCQDASY